MKVDRKLAAGILALGSLWGVSEILLGSILRDADLPAGALLTSVVALGLLVFGRMQYQQRGLALGMGLVAGTLRLVNPFGGCFLCSALAIMAEGALFELLLVGLSSDLRELKSSLVMQSCLGIVSAYALYVGGYIITQTLTPVLSSAGFSPADLVAVLPQIFASGLLAAVVGAVTAPAVFALRKAHLTLRSSLYYPVTVGTAATSWCLAAANTLAILWL